MNYEDVQKLSNAAKNKIGLLNGNFLKYFLRAVMAGFFIDVAVTARRKYFRIRSCLGQVSWSCSVLHCCSSDQPGWRRAVYR